MTSKNAAGTAQNAQRTEAGLERKYGEIGISAVAAALRYKSATKNPAYAPVVVQPDKRHADLAA